MYAACRISTVYGQTSSKHAARKVLPGDDALEAQWFTVDEFEQLDHGGLSHGMILRTAKRGLAMLEQGMFSQD